MIDGHTDDMPAAKIAITLWADDSLPAHTLENKLKEKGYVINKVLTASSAPILHYGNRYIGGYADIYLQLQL